MCISGYQDFVCRKVLSSIRRMKKGRIPEKYAVSLKIRGADTTSFRISILPQVLCKSWLLQSTVKTARGECDLQDRGKQVFMKAVMQFMRSQWALKHQSPLKCRDLSSSSSHKFLRYHCLITSSPKYGPHGYFIVHDC